MKAILCKQFGEIDSLVFEETETPIPADNQVLIDVKACGVNFPDTLMVQGKYQFKPDFPFSPGGEVAGIVETIGSNVKHLKVGDKVFSLTGHGGFAEKVLGDANKTFPMPPDMDFVTAASTMYTYGTSYHALKDRAKIKAGETILIMGAAGGVGLAAVQLAKILGAKVIAAASTPEKLAICKELGADEVINYETENIKDRIKELTNGIGVDVVYDAVGDRFAEPAIRSLAWKGRYLVVGFAAGEIPKIPLNLALLKGASIVGVFWGKFAEIEPINSLQNFMEILKFIKEGSLKQHIHKIYPLAEAKESLHDMANRKVVGKCIIDCDSID
jgi:NADPH:quinone reductase